MTSILCKLGLHDWTYNPEFGSPQRWCVRCGKQENLGEFGWIKIKEVNLQNSVSKETKA